MNDTKQNDLFSVMSDIEESMIYFMMVQNLIQVYDECIDRELQILRDSSEPRANHFMKRFELLQSQIDSIQMQMREAVDKMSKSVQTGYDISHCLKTIANCV